MAEDTPVLGVNRSIPRPREAPSDERPALLISLCALLLDKKYQLSDVVSAMPKNDKDEVIWFNLNPVNLVLEQVTGPADEARLQIAIRSRVVDEPGWLESLRRLGVQLATSAEGSTKPSVLIAVTAQTEEQRRTVIWCFGTISRSVRSDFLDGRFGLIVALNKHMAGKSLPPWMELPKEILHMESPGDPGTLVRAINGDVTGGHRHRLQARATGPTPVEGFRFDSTADLVRGVVVRTNDPMMKEIEGSRSLRFPTYVSSIADFATLSDYIIRVHDRHDYQSEWDWIDHIVQVEDLETQNAVLNLIHRRVVDNEEFSIDFLLPDVLVDNTMTDSEVRFALPHERGISRTSLSWNEIQSWLIAQPIEQHNKPVLRKNMRVQVIGPEPETKKVPILSMLAAEVADTEGTFILSDGDIFSVDTPFLKRIDHYLATIPWSTFNFPDYAGGTEPGYLEKAECRSHGRLAKIDGQNIRLEGETPFEPCDLVSDNGRLIFAKLKGRSAPFSHLCTQAETAAEMFKRLGPARDELALRVNAATSNVLIRRAAARILNALAADRAQDVTITLLLLGSWRKRDLATLPLVSKVRLRRAAQQIRGYGYRFEVASPALVNN